MLHLIFQSAFDSALLQRIDNGDDVVFFENAIFRLNKVDALNGQLQALINNRVYLHVIEADLATRGLTAIELLAGVELIDYPALVALTEKNKVIRTWC